MKAPQELGYSKSHEWVAREGGNIVRIGITDFAQSELGDVIYLELPPVGNELTTDDPFGTVESVKAVSDLIAPVSGKVIEVNSSLVDEPGAINSEPYESWMVRVEMSNPAELDALMSAADYEAFTAA
jgi:glycine cleavage system H protein